MTRSVCVTDGPACHTGRIAVVGGNKTSTAGFGFCHTDTGAPSNRSLGTHEHTSASRPYFGAARALLRDRVAAPEVAA